jgi:ketosteroid isomerase-like protein
MSRENVEIVRASIEAFESGDIESALNALDPEIEWHATVGGIDEGRVYRGREEVVQGFVDYFAVWERMEMRAEKFIDAGDEEVVVFHHEVAKGRQSGVVVETETGTVQTVRDGKIVRVRSYMDRDEALKAAGLREEGLKPKRLLGDPKSEGPRRPPAPAA